jgi:hypothetical protein
LRLRRKRSLPTASTRRPCDTRRTLRAAWRRGLA